MMPLAITELGTDSWITGLMGPEMEAVELNAGWVLVYTSFLMMVLRFCAGPIVHAFSPLGLLTISAALAIAGLMYLSAATGSGILIAAGFTLRNPQGPLASPPAGHWRHPGRVHRARTDRARAQRQARHRDGVGESG